MTDKAAVEQILLRAGELPAIPGIVTEVLSLTSDPNVSISDVSKLIERDPVMTSRLLKLSNSAYYGMRQVVGTLKLALVILGVREVRNIVVGISALEVLRDEDTAFLLGERGLWAHSVMVGGIAKKLAVELQLSLQGEDFIAGLLHDIGKLLLWKQLGQEYKDLYGRAEAENLCLYTVEEEAYGFNHADVGGALATSWNLPVTLISALELHHSVSAQALLDGPAPKLAALVRIANAASHDDFETESADPPASCMDDDAWRLLAAPGRRLELETRWKILARIREELQEMPVLDL